MADVRLLVIPTAVGLLALQRAITFPFAVEWHRWVLLAAAVLVVLLGRQAAFGLVAAIVLVLGAELYNHLLFGMWTLLTWALFTDVPQRRFVTRWQLSILYGFAGIAKLTPRWLSGDGLASVIDSITGTTLLPAGLAQPAALGAVTAELFLAVALWRPRLRPVVLVVGTAVHLGLATLRIWSGPLVFFNGLALLWLWDATRSDDVDEAGRPWHLGQSSPPSPSPTTSRS